ncbi:MAG: TonB-dependent receptor [Bacteroidota bacterium]
MPNNYLPRLLVFLCLLLTIPLTAQRPGGGGNWGGGRGGAPKIKGAIKGKVLDAQTQEPVEFATVLLVKSTPSGDVQMDGIVTEADGSFKLNDVKTGKYTVKISFIGYEELVIADVETTPKKPDYDVKTVKLSSDAVVLEAAEVTAEAAIVENRIDKIVYNADKDATNIGGDASDVLRKVPLLSVDLDGNVSLRGSSNLQILINGRPSTIFATSVADALKSIPGDQIKSVEVITTPSARYDGEGSGGIINIITKKKEAQGFTGTVSSSIGTRQNNGGLNVNALLGRFGLIGVITGFWRGTRPGSSNFLREDLANNSVIRTLNQIGDNRNNVIGINGSGGAFYDFNAYNSINVNARLNSFARFNDGDNEGFLDNINSPLIEFTRLTNSENLRAGYDITTDYRKTFPDKKDKELIIAFQVSGNDSEAENISDQSGTIPLYQRDIYNFNDGKNLEYTFQIDFVQPFSDKVKMETGVKSVIRRIDSDYRTLVKENDEADFVESADLTDFFSYDQDVYAGFLSFNLNFGKKWGLVAGARYEHTEIRGDFRSENPSFQNDYDNLLPSIILSRKLSNFSSLKWSYTQRIQRPSLFFVNPFTAISDPNNLQVGNPDLAPEVVDQYEMSYNNYIKGVVINASVFYRSTRDVIESFLVVADDGIASETTYLNIGSSDNYGVNLFTSATLFKILTLRGGVNYLRYNGTGFVGNQELSRSADIWSGNVGGSLKLTKKLRIDMFGFFRGRRQTLQGSSAAFGLFSLGANWQITERTTAGIRTIEPFAENKAFPSELSGADFRQESNFVIPFRSIGLSFSHKFGQIDFRQQNRRTRVKNDDQKAGDGNNNF